jgi:hypothetical protein
MSQSIDDVNVEKSKQGVSQEKYAAQKKYLKNKYATNTAYSDSIKEKMKNKYWSDENYRAAAKQRVKERYERMKFQSIEYQKIMSVISS